VIRPLLCLTALSLLAQGPPAPSKKAPEELPTRPPISSNPVKELVRAELSPAETGSPEALLTSLYSFISGPKDQKRDLERIRALFHLQARIVVTAKHPDKGAFLRPVELEGFLSFALPQWAKTGFFEKGLTMSVQKQGGLAQVWSIYEIRLAEEGPVLYTGVNALQCAWDGKRWWIMHLAFESQATAALEAVPAPSSK
jgi:hypothetical protein